MSSSPSIAVQAENLSKTYLLYASPQDRLKQFFVRGRRQFFTEVQALRDVSFSVRKGEALGIVGRNGSGKSTLLQMLCGIVTPTSGTLSVTGRISALLELGAGFNPEFTGRENVYLNAAILGFPHDAIEARMDDILSFAGIGHFIDQPVKTYSSGMVVRLAFAVAVAIDPDILVVDEALAVGDEAFQRKCYARIRAMKERGATILFVSHSSQTVADMCDRALLLDRGEMLMHGEPKRVIAAYHQMIYAPETQQDDLRTRLKQGVVETPAPAAPITTPITLAANDAPPPPESRVEYTPRGGHIHDPQITTLQDEPTTLLRCGEYYRYRYRVTAQEDLQRLKFGMLIKTVTGFELGGAASGGKQQYFALLKKGETLEVVFTFRCLLRRGAYFLNCGCTREENGEDIFVHRIIDACQFRVLAESDNAAIKITGIIDFDVSATLLLHDEQRVNKKSRQ